MPAWEAEGVKVEALGVQRPGSVSSPLVLLGLIWLYLQWLAALSKDQCGREVFFQVFS